KGVAVPHAGLLNLVSWHQRTFGVESADRATQLASPGFDAAVWEIWPYLTVGACVCLPTDETRMSPPLLRDWLLSQRVTISFVPTPIAEQLLPLPWPPQAPLRILLTGGDQLHHSPGALPFQLINNYGPTENSV